ncbi:MAG: ABC transporter ATP-binding protein [Bacteroidetes bacterium]|nr:ABC transporter ATP-binding protein [Bacteroidota bacterium]MCH8523682.1 ABC transporter ATP-binding protein [Balneolales bacterium]
MKHQNPSDTTLNPIITLSNTEKRYQRNSFSLHPTSIQIGKGQFICLVGPNGSGKSTFIKLITRLIHPSNGSVDYSDSDIAMGYVPEIVDLPGSFTCRQLIGLMVADDTNNSYANEFIELFNVAEYIDKPITKLSKGMQKKVGMIGALAGNPNVLVLDEPLEGLDTIDRTRLLNFLKSKVEHGLTVILSTHILYDLDTVTDASFFIKNGSIKLRLSGYEITYLDEVEENMKLKINQLLQNRPADTISELYHVLYGGER